METFWFVRPALIVGSEHWLLNRRPGVCPYIYHRPSKFIDNSITIQLLSQMILYNNLFWKVTRVE
jgi:hypothetical protein